MGCECFRNIFRRSEPYKEEKKEPLFEPEEDPNAFNYEKAKDIVKQCLLSENDFYKCFCDDVLSLDKENFKQELVKDTVFVYEINNKIKPNLSKKFLNQISLA